MKKVLKAKQCFEMINCTPLGNSIMQNTQWDKSNCSAWAIVHGRFVWCMENAPSPHHVIPLPYEIRLPELCKSMLWIYYAPNSNVKGLSSTVSQIVRRDNGLVPPIHNILTQVTVSNSMGSNIKKNNPHSITLLDFYYITAPPLTLCTYKNMVKRKHFNKI